MFCNSGFQTVSPPIYPIYNEVIVLQNLMKSDLYNKISGLRNEMNNNGIEHNIIQYADNTNNVIATNNIANIQPYIDSYFILIENFYQINKLIINPEKSKIMIVCKAAERNETLKIVINTRKRVIE